MAQTTKKNTAEVGRKQQRRRLRGMFSSRTGRTIGLTSLAVPMIGYIVNDLQKPDSVIRGLVGAALRKMLPDRSKRADAIDITDKVEVLDRR